MSRYILHFEVDFGRRQGCQCASQYPSKIGVLKSAAHPGPPVDFPQVHPLINTVRADLIISEDNQAAKICRPCHHSAHRLDDGRSLGPIVSLYPPVKDDVYVEVRFLPEPDITAGAPTSLPSKRRFICICVDLSLGHIIRCWSSCCRPPNKLTPQGFPLK